MNPHIVIVGGGVIGSAIASFTLADPAFRGTVTVVERDPTYARASSALSASSIRQQFSTAINIEIGRYGIDIVASPPGKRKGRRRASRKNSPAGAVTVPSGRALRAVWEMALAAPVLRE